MEWEIVQPLKLEFEDDMLGEPMKVESVSGPQRRATNINMPFNVFLLRLRKLLALAISNLPQQATTLLKLMALAISNLAQNAQPKAKLPTGPTRGH